MMSKCNQFSCAYNPDNDSVKDKKQRLLCPICEECKAEPHLVTNGCKNCLLCENREGFIRKGSPKNCLVIEMLQENKPEDVENVIPKYPNYVPLQGWKK